MLSWRVARRWRVLFVVFAALLAVVIGLLVFWPSSRQNPMRGADLYNDHQTPANAALRDALADGRPADARLLSKITSQPVATWVTGADGMADKVAEVTEAAAKTKTVAVLVLYNLPNRTECGGTAGQARGYDNWLKAMSSAIHGPAVVVVEPDAVPLVEHCGKHAQAHYAMLANAVETFQATSGVVATYLDAGNSAWFADASQLVEPLVRSGAKQADGIATNVSNFIATDQEAAWALKLTRLLKHATGHELGVVIDVSRNGNGAHLGTDIDTWCNPPGRALGHEPTVNAGIKGVDALLWIKPPGESDGNCRPGEPNAGQFWLKYALGLAS